MGDLRPKRYVQRTPLVVTAMPWLPGDLPAAGVLVGWLMALGVHFSHPSGSGETTTLHLLEPNIMAQPGWWICHRSDGYTYCLPPGDFAGFFDPEDTRG